MKKFNRIMVGLVCGTSGGFGTFVLIHGMVAQQSQHLQAFDLKIGLACFAVMFAVMAVSEQFFNGDGK